ncbi:MAG TPA: carboxypeptidase-like regulatory domain-containing protein, partial [Pedobacter sp.]
GGYNFGKVPFPLLTIHAANQTYAYQTYSYNLMNFLEFVSDHYVSLNVDHNFNGLFFNHIPLLRKLKLREYFTFKGLYGGLRAENDPAKNPGTLQFPVNSDGVPTTYSLGKTPYIESGVGVGNIFKVIRLDMVRRFNYLDNPGVSKYGLRARVQFEF